MAEPPSRSPGGRDRTPERIVALTAVSGLIVLLFVLVVLMTGGGEPGPAAPGQPHATATPPPGARAHAGRRRAHRPVTARERAQRSAAAGLVDGRGYHVVRMGDYDPHHRLRVLIGRDLAGERLAFFFVGGHYVGNDSTAPSTALRVRRTTTNTATLAYRVYPARSSGGRSHPRWVEVRFVRRGRGVVPRDAVPPPARRSLAAQPR